MDEQTEELEAQSTNNVGSPFGQKNSKQFRNNLTWGNKFADQEVMERDQQVNLKIQLNNSEVGKASRNNKNAKTSGYRSKNVSMGNNSPGNYSPAKSSVMSSQIKLH